MDGSRWSNETTCSSCGEGRAVEYADDGGTVDDDADDDAIETSVVVRVGSGRKSEGGDEWGVMSMKPRSRITSRSKPHKRPVSFHHETTLGSAPRWLLEAFHLLTICEGGRRANWVRNDLMNGEGRETHVEWEEEARVLPALLADGVEHKNNVLDGLRLSAGEVLVLAGLHRSSRANSLELEEHGNLKREARGQPHVSLEQLVRGMIYVPLQQCEGRRKRGRCLLQARCSPPTALRRRPAGGGSGPQQP